MNPESHILQSWQQNATAWTDTVRQNRIESRTLVTNQAIVEAVTALRPRSVLDLGCGEGWLARTLVSRGSRVVGVDAVPTLIEQARAAGGATYHVSSYEDIIQGSLASLAPFKTVVCNFSLFAETLVDRLIQYIPQLLGSEGHLVIQTLHPLMALGDHPYCDGWRDGSWQGFSEAFVNPAPWYFRTLASWIALMNSHGLTLDTVQEPIHPQTQQPASIIFVSKRSILHS